MGSIMQNFENKCRILSDLWIHNKNEEKEEDFVVEYDLYELIRYADLSLPLAYLINAELVTPKEESLKLIDEAYDILVEFLDLDANEDFETFQQIVNELEE
jgi:hypothetical protein